MVAPRRQTRHHLTNVVLVNPLLKLRCCHHRNIDDKYSRREEYRGFTQDFKEKDNYRPDVKIEYVDESGRKLTPKEVSICSASQPVAFLDGSSLLQIL